MTPEDLLMKFVGWPALIAIIAAIICAKFVSKRPYVIIFFGILGALVGYGFVYS